jgi:hypothetical protein
MDHNYKYTAMIVEPRKHKALHFVLNNVLDCLSDEWQVLFFHGLNNIEYSTPIVNELNEKYNNRITLIQLNVENLDQRSYSRLLTDENEIYNHIKTEYFLVFQTDSIILKRNSHLINVFIDGDYDYIGAPWLVCNYPPTRDRDFIGNGGFSLRKKSKMLEIIRNDTWDVNYEWHEDLFFTKKREGITLKKPSYEDAKMFCVEEVFSNIALGCHKAWWHNHFEEFTKLYPECKELHSLQGEE